MSEISYKDAGVDLRAAEESKTQIKRLLRSTFSPNVLCDIGLFGGFFKLDVNAYKEPVLVSSVDGVGTKLKIAFMMGIHDTVGQDLVNHCVNDVMTSGAVPLFFLDYLAFGKLEKKVVEQVIEGLVRGCQNASCALIGGETAEMPGMYNAGEYDVSGTMVGIVEREKILDGRGIRAGDILIGLPSNGLHTNGYSLARKVLLEVKKYRLDQYFDDLGMTLGEELLRIHRSYRDVIVKIKDRVELKGMSHITGGGIIGNTRRILPGGLDLKIFWENWEVPAIFLMIQRGGHISDEEMRQVFNLGVGFIFVVSQNDVESLLHELNMINEKPIFVGEVV